MCARSLFAFFANRVGHENCNEFTASLTKAGWGWSLAEIELRISGREFRAHPFRKVRGKGWGTLFVGEAKNAWASLGTLGSKINAIVRWCRFWAASHQ